MEGQLFIYSSGASLKPARYFAPSSPFLLHLQANEKERNEWMNEKHKERF